LALMTPGQQEWVLAMRLQLEDSDQDTAVLDLPVLPEGSSAARACVHAMVRHPVFEYTVMMAIVLNTAALMVQHQGMSHGLQTSLEVMNLAFVVIFGIEAGAKLLAFGCMEYFLVVWNVFDFLLLMVAILGIALGDLGSAGTVFRALRLLRVLRLVRYTRSLRSLLTTLVLSTPALLNVGLLLALFIYMWSALGMALIGEVPGGTVVDHNFNFATVGPACLLMLRVLCTDGWIYVLEDVSSNGPGCSAAYEPCGIPAVVAIMFFGSFMILCTFIVLNIFIAVILVNFQDSSLGNGLMEMQHIMAINHKRVLVRKMVGNLRNRIGAKKALASTPAADKPAEVNPTAGTETRK